MASGSLVDGSITEKVTPLGTDRVYLASDPLGTPANVWAELANLGKAISDVNKVTITAPASNAILTIANLKTLTVNNTLTLAGTDGSTLNIGAGGTLGSAAFTSAASYLTVGGNAVTATALQTARTINGVSFDGTANITVTAAGSTLSDTVTVAKGGTGLTSLGAALQVLRVNAGATALEFAAPAAGGVTSVGLVGTADQITVTGSSPITGTGSFTLSIPASAILVTPVCTTNITTPLIKSAGTLILQTNGSTTALTLGTDQSATFAGPIIVSFTGDGSSIAGSIFIAGNAVNFDRATGQTRWYSGAVVGWTSGAASGTLDVGLGRNNVGIAEINNGTLNTFRDLKLRTLINSGSVNTAYWTATGYSLTGSSSVPMVDLAGTLNNGATNVDVLKFSTIVTGTGTGSKLLNLLAGAGGLTSMFSVGMDGSATFAGAITSALDSTSGGIRFVDGSTVIYRPGAAGYLRFRASNVDQLEIGNTPAYIAFPSTGQLIFTNGALGSGVSVSLGQNTAGVLEINSGTAGTFRDLKLRHLLAESGVAIPAGGTAGVGLAFSSTANFGVFFGSGAPTLAAAKGSLYLRSDGSGVGDRGYINTDGSTAWAAITTAS